MIQRRKIKLFGRIIRHDNCNNYLRNMFEGKVKIAKRDVRRHDADNRMSKLSGNGAEKT